MLGSRSHDPLPRSSALLQVLKKNGVAEYLSADPEVGLYGIIRMIHGGDSGMKKTQAFSPIPRISCLRTPLYRTIIQKLLSLRLLGKLRILKFFTLILGQKMRVL